jgi:hypothetical protein
VQHVVENDRVPPIDNRAHGRSYRVDEATEHRAEYGGDTLRLPRRGGCQQPGPLKNGTRPSRSVLVNLRRSSTLGPSKTRNRQSPGTDMDG